MLSKCVKVRILLFPPQIPLVPREYKYIGAINFNNEVSVIEYYGDVRTIDLSNYDKEHTLPVYRKLTDKDARYLVLMGGGGSGKSHYISRLIPRRTLGSDEPMKTLVIRNVKEDNRNSTFAELKSAITEMGIEEFFKINKSTMDIECTRNEAESGYYPYFQNRGLDRYIIDLWGVSLGRNYHLITTQT